MANSAIIISLKKKIADAICNDEDICSMIDSPKYDGKELKNTHIFTYDRNPNTITENITFITLQVNTVVRDTNGTFVTPKLIVTIYSHLEHMDVKFGTQLQEYNRNDYLSILLDELLNDSIDYTPLGNLQLVSNTEGIATEKFSYRRLVFNAVDFDNSLCQRW